MKGKVVVVQGGQYGSESKGAYAAWRVLRDRIPYAVRTGSINAGHTVDYKGQTFKMQQVPTAWVRPETNLVIGAGAYIHPEILAREIRMIEEATGEDVRHRLYIDKRCGIHLPKHEDAARTAGRHIQMGATGKGCAEAIIDKIKDREPGVPHLFMDYESRNWGWMVDTVDMLNSALERGDDVLLEGTQGTLLDLHHGDYPFVTSRQTTSAAWLAEAGISPSWDVHVVLVMRTYPIRVAGNSGPMPSEITWQSLWRKWQGHSVAPQVPDSAIDIFNAASDDFARRDGWDRLKHFASEHIKLSLEDRITYRRPLSSAQSEALRYMEERYPEAYQSVRAAMELTTVTLKPRRIAEWDMQEAIRAAKIEKPSEIVLTFANYLFPELWGAGRDAVTAHGHLGGVVMDIEAAMNADITAVSTGPGLAGIIAL